MPIQPGPPPRGFGEGLLPPLSSTLRTPDWDLSLMGERRPIPVRRDWGMLMGVGQRSGANISSSVS